MSSKFTRVLLCGVILTLLLITQSAVADNVYATVPGTVTDSTGAILPAVQLTATNTQTGVSTTTTSQDNGRYEFLQLPVGTYTISATKQGFKTYKSTPLTLTVNQIYELAVGMQVGTVSETVEVKADAVQVETTSIQQQTLVNSQEIVDLPLNGRNFTQLQQLAPGVMAGSDRFGVGIGGTNFATNGSQTQQNSFTVNGLDINDIPLNSAQILPSPDAIQEFNLISSTINPEYGRNSGGIVNALIKNGTNQFHGTAFEFFRDNTLNARSFFSPLNTEPVFHQNQFGGTFGGPIWKDKTFFFLSYQGTYNHTGGTSGAPTNTTVFTPDQRSGIFTDLPASGGASPRPLVDEFGVTQPAGTAYSALFPTGHIPAADLDPLAVKLMNQFVPLPNGPGGQFSFNPIDTLKANQGIVRVDHNITKNDLLWGVYLVEDAPDTSALPFTGATLLGFTEVDKARTNDIVISWSHTFNTTTLNEAKIGYARFNFDAVEPQTSALPSTFGFSDIVPQNTKSASMPLIAVTGFFNLGFSNNGPQPRKDQNYQFTDNFSKVIGRHTLKLGFDVRRFQVDNPFFFNNNGFFGFGGGGAFSTGDPGADYLLGIPDSYAQSAGGVINARAYEYYSYFQDQWKVKNNLTLTFGSGYQVDTPYNNNQFGGEAFNCFIPTQQSKIFPTAPLGLNYPGDTGCTRSGTVTHYGHIGPRFGFAWSPNLGPVSGGGTGKFSVRGGFGMYFNRTEEEGALQNLGAPPFGVTSSGANTTNPFGQVGFADPFFDQTTGTTSSTVFPFTSFPTPGQPVNFDALGPQFINVIDPNLTTPYAMNYNLTLQREFPANTVLSLAYVGSMGRHLYRAYEANQITPAGQAACKVDPVCVAFAGVQALVFPNHLIDPATIQTGPSAGLPSLAAVGMQHTDGTSNFNSFQVNVNKGVTHGLTLLASYTWSHTIDNGSSFEDSGFGFRGVNPFVPALNVGDSSNDARQRLVFSYVYALPSLHHVANWAPDRIFGGWKLSGITTFQDGFPINISTNNPSSLFCNGISFYACPDNPNQVAPVVYLNPKTSSIKGRGDFYFNPAAFAQVPRCHFTAGVLTNGNVCGQFGNVARNTVRAPGIDNFDMAFSKDTKITERTQIELGIEAFNLFNHTNFVFLGENATSHGNISSGNFGRITASAPGRILQIRAKVIF